MCQRTIFSLFRPSVCALCLSRPSSVAQGPTGTPRPAMYNTVHTVDSDQIAPRHSCKRFAAPLQVNLTLRLSRKSVAPWGPNFTLSTLRSRLNLMVHQGRNLVAKWTKFPLMYPYIESGLAPPRILWNTVFLKALSAFGLCSKRSPREADDPLVVKLWFN